MQNLQPEMLMKNKMTANIRQIFIEQSFATSLKYKMNPDGNLKVSTVIDGQESKDCTGATQFSGQDENATGPSLQRKNLMFD